MPQLPGTLPSIHKAVCDPHLSLDTVEAILWEDPSCLNSANPQNGFTPLHAAARRAHSGLIKLLIKSGADLEARWRGGETAFLMACKVNCSLLVASLTRSQVPSQQKEGDPGVRLMPLAGVPLVYRGQVWVASGHARFVSQARSTSAREGRVW